MNRAIRILAHGDSHDYRPDWLLRILAALKPDLVIHTGDIESMTTMAVLERWTSELPAKFCAVRGDKDTTLGQILKRKIDLEIAGLRIGVIHGDRHPDREYPSKLVNEHLQGRGYWWNGFSEDALDQFSSKLHILFTGHTHIPFRHKVENTWVINPGAIKVNGKAHHLNRPTLAVVDISGSEFDATFFQVTEERDLAPLVVGEHGPCNGTCLIN